MTDAQRRAEAHHRDCAERFRVHYFNPLMERLFLKLHTLTFDDDDKKRSPERTGLKPR